MVHQRHFSLPVDGSLSSTSLYYSEKDSGFGASVLRESLACFHMSLEYPIMIGALSFNKLVPIQNVWSIKVLLFIKGAISVKAH